jgi:hypothetical protein
LSLLREKIGREKLIESEREGFGVELTLSTRMARGTNTNEVIRLTRISLKTTTIDATVGTSIELIIVVETFHSSVIIDTHTQIEIITETETSAIGDTNVMISKGGRIFRGECPLMFTSID